MGSNWASVARRVSLALRGPVLATCECTNTYMCIYVYIYMCIYIYTYECVYICTYVHIVYTCTELTKHCSLWELPEAAPSVGSNRDLNKL